MTHPHEHSHEHGAPSRLGGAAENPWAGQGAVLLDIGDDVGALVVAMPAGMLDVEVEIRPVGAGPPSPPAGSGPGHHPHVAVVARPAGTDTVPSLVYPSLGEGRYELYEVGTDTVDLTVSVRGGYVTEAEWPTTGPPGR